MFEQSNDVDRDCQNCVTPNVEVFNFFSFQKKYILRNRSFFGTQILRLCSYRQMTKTVFVWLGLK